MTDFEKQLSSLINRNSLENDSDTPDFVLAEYLLGCLEVYNKTVRKRETWYGRSPRCPLAVEGAEEAVTFTGPPVSAKAADAVD